VNAADIPDRTSEYEIRDLHQEGDWPIGEDPRYGGVVFSVNGQVLLREPRDHFGGYVWTFAKGGPKSDEPPVTTALREVQEEMGLRPRIIGHIPGRFESEMSGSASYFYLMLSECEAPDVGATSETISVRWLDWSDAASMISETQYPGGRQRDLRILQAGIREFVILNP